MPKCTAIDPLVTPYVDGEIGPENRQLVDEHLRRCPPCHARVAAERAVRALLQAKKADLSAGCASDALRVRCANLRSAAVWRRPRLWAAPTWRTQPMRFAVAAALVLIVGTFVYQLTGRSSKLLAAELAADHVKCFGINRVLNTHHAPAAVEEAMASGFGWHMRLPEAAERAGLELVGARPCLYGQGRIAHIMYRHNGEPVSIFMLPKKTRPQDIVDVMGYQAVIWPAGERTFVLIASEPREEVTRVASVVQAALR